MSNMFHKPIKKELAALVESKRPKRRVHPNHTKPASNSNGSPNDSGSSTPVPNLTPVSSSLTPKLKHIPTRPDSEDEDYTPSSSFSDFRIMSAPKQQWKYNVMKFAESKDKDVDLAVWRQPVKLNRKEYRPVDRSGSGTTGNLVGNGNGSGGEDVKKTPMLGPDGKPVIGPDGRIVMVGPDGKVASSLSFGSNAVAGSSKSGGGFGKTTASNGKSKAKQAPRKKIKQVFLVPDEVRKLRREERYPWIFEEAPLEVKPTEAVAGADGSSNGTTSSATLIPGQIWVGYLENPEKGQTHGLLVPKGSTFQFVPSHRYYKFTKKRSDVPGAEEAEAEYAKLQKSKDPTQLWKRRKGALSEATMKTLKSESQSHNLFSVKSEDGDDFDDSSRRLRTVDAGGDDLFGGARNGGEDDEYDEEKMMRKRRNRELGQDGDMDEMEYEEEFADDDEKIEMDGDDEEMREMEERLKKEYRNANKARDATIDEDDDDEEMEEMNRLTGAGKDLKKLVKRTEKNDAYESDDDEGNPYASEEEEEEQIPQPILDGPAVMNQQQQPSSGTSSPLPGSASSSGPARPASMQAISTSVPFATTVPTPKQLPHSTSAYVPKPSSPSNASRPGSPLSAGGLAPPGMGNAIVAKRATSPKVGKARTVGGNGNSGGSGVLTSGGGRSPSPSPLGVGNRGGTPTKSPMASRAASPVPPVPPTTITTTGLKRKAPDESQAPVSPPSPTSAADPTSAGASSNKPPRKKTKRPPPGPLDESLIISFLREKKDATTKDCIQRFQPYLREEETKKTFTAMVKKVAVVKKDILVLRDEYM